VLPLLLDDDDWDRLGDRLAELVPGLDEPDEKRLLLALAEAFDAVDDGRRRELEATAEETLRLLARTWAREHRAPPIGVLADWFFLRSQVRTELPLPDLAAAWFEVVPAESSEGAVTTAELTDFEEWVALVELLDEQAPDLLQKFGYPESVVRALESFASRVEQSRPFEDNAGVARVLARLADVCPPLASRLREAVHAILASGLKYVHVETYSPRQLSPEMAQLLDAPAASEGGSAIVPSCSPRSLGPDAGALPTPALRGTTRQHRAVHAGGGWKQRLIAVCRRSRILRPEIGRLEPELGSGRSQVKTGRQRRILRHEPAQTQQRHRRNRPRGRPLVD